MISRDDTPLSDPMDWEEIAKTWEHFCKNAETENNHLRAMLHNKDKVHEKDLDTVLKMYSDEKLKVKFRDEKIRELQREPEYLKRKISRLESDILDLKARLRPLEIIHKKAGYR